ncbi:MAG: GGDEF domain-containing protein [Planctomycetes bacterium]|nr:GGDEF domain-containing protein [Planctomycetota bacterium]
MDVILDVMRAEHGSIMLLDDSNQELTVKSARGLKREIINKACVRLGSGIAGKVAARGLSVFLKGNQGERSLEIGSEDLVNPEIDTAFVAPIKLIDRTIGVININSTHSDHEITPSKERMVNEILHHFSEYLIQVDVPANHHEPPSELYMMNIFREYSTLRELRGIFDYIFQLISEVLRIKKKGFFLLRNTDTGFFDLVLGYGFKTKNYREIYEDLIPQFKEARIDSLRNVTVFNRDEFSLISKNVFSESSLILIPLEFEGVVKGHILFLDDAKPELDSKTRQLVKTICEIVAKTIEESISGRKFRELTFTDSLTGTYNYGLWWRRLNEEISRVQRQSNMKISLIVIDIDKFNRLNQAHGYFVGDQLLRIIADRITGSVRPTDIVGRIGGEEFGIVLGGTEKQLALNVARRIVDAVSGISAEMRIKLSHPITFSCGIAEYPSDATTSGGLVERSKMALVSAKIMGGNRIKLFEPLEE